MKEIDMDLHDEESSFDEDLEALDVDFGNLLDDEDESNEEKELVFYRRLDDY